MERTITAGGKPYKIRASAGALIIYKAQFGADYTEDLIEGKEDDEKAYIVGCRLLWAMARSAKEKLPAPNDWINSFKPKELEKALICSNEMFMQSLSVCERHGKGEQFQAEKFRALAALSGLSYDDLNIMPIGMVLNTIEHYMNIRYDDGDDYVSAADFFGE